MSFEAVFAFIGALIVVGGFLLGTRWVADKLQDLTDAIREESRRLSTAVENADKTLERGLTLTTQGVEQTPHAIFTLQETIRETAPEQLVKARKDAEDQTAAEQARVHRVLEAVMAATQVDPKPDELLGDRERMAYTRGTTEYRKGVNAALKPVLQK